MEGLVGCGIIYVLKMQDLKLGSDFSIYDPEAEGSHIPMDQVDHLELIDGTALYLVSTVTPATASQ